MMRLAVTSVALAIIVMIISWAVVVGFKNQIRDKVIGFVAPVHVQALDKNESVEETPFVMDSLLVSRLGAFDEIGHYQMVANKAGMIKTEDEIQGVVLKGVGSDYDWSYFSSCLIEGEVPAYSDSVRSSEVLVSKVIANKMLLKTGDDVRVWFVDKDMPALAELKLWSGAQCSTECIPDGQKAMDLLLMNLTLLMVIQQEFSLFHLW